MEDKQLAFYKKLIGIQSKLKVPKTLTNSFGRYKYRSAELILEAVKPLLKEYDLFGVISDHIEVFDGRTYVKAVFTITDGVISVSNHAYAKEDESKKGMDAAQLTGATSSYARKYALNGMFLIDDTKDMDSDEFHKENEAKEKEKFVIFTTRINTANTKEEITTLAKEYEIKDRGQKWRDLANQRYAFVSKMEEANGK